MFLNFQAKIIKRSFANSIYNISWNILNGKLGKLLFLFMVDFQSIQLKYFKIVFATPKIDFYRYLKMCIINSMNYALSYEL